MKHIPFDEALVRLANGKDVTMYKPVKEPERLQLSVLKEMTEHGAFFAVDEEEPADKGVVKPMEDKAKKRRAPNSLASRKTDYGRMQALRNAGWKVKDIAADCRCSEVTVYKHTVAPEV